MPKQLHSFRLRTENNPANGPSFSCKRLKVSLDLDFGDHNLMFASLVIKVRLFLQILRILLFGKAKL